MLRRLTVDGPWSCHRVRASVQAESKMEKLRKKADVINESTDISEREKASSITKLMRNKEKKVRAPCVRRTPFRLLVVASSDTAPRAPHPQKDTVSVVVARGSSKGSRSRPTGVKGRYKVRAEQSPVAALGRLLTHSGQVTQTDGRCTHAQGLARRQGQREEEGPQQQRRQEGRRQEVDDRALPEPACPG